MPLSMKAQESTPLSGPLSLADVTPVILAGGPGVRLFPLSRPSRPKPYLRLGARHSLLQKTLLRTAGMAPPLVVCSEAHQKMAAGHVRAAGVERADYLAEPLGRNTAPAIAAACFFLAGKAKALLVMPSDHIIPDHLPLHNAVERGLELARQGWLVTFGIRPCAPETRYGYIRRGEALCEDIYAVGRFHEKPDRAAACRYLQEGGYEWNSGIFLFSPEAFLAALQKICPDIHERVGRALEKGAVMPQGMVLDRDAFACVPAVSIDRAVMEHTGKAAVIPVDMSWRDLGTWPSLFSYFLES